MAAGKPISNVKRFVRALDHAIKRSGLSGPKVAEKASATGVNVAQSTIATWLGGKRPGRPDQVFAVEKALDLPPGALSAYLGYLPVELYRISIETAIAAATSLDDQTRAGLMAILTNVSGGEGEGRGAPKGSSK